MPELERVYGLRIVARPPAIDTVRWPDGPVLVLRFAPDELLAIGAPVVLVDDDYAIVDDELGFVAAECDLASLASHIEWAIPDARPILLQGAIAGVPAKLWLAADDGRALLLTHAAYALELTHRLGWDR